MAEVINIATLPSRSLSLKDRVRRKRELLKQWLSKGVPHDHLDGLPKSLNAARIWSIPELDIHPIGSPNNFTTNHPEVGDDVRAIGDFILKLNAKLPPPKRKRRSPSSAPTISAKEVEQAIIALVSQWHVARDEARHWKELATRAETHRDIAREELKAKEAEVAELRRRLAGGLSLVR